MQVWANCRLYNPEGEPILQQCSDAEALVEKYWAQEGLRLLANKGKQKGKKKQKIAKHESQKPISQSSMKDGISQASTRVASQQQSHGRRLGESRPFIFGISICYNDY